MALTDGPPKEVEAGGKLVKAGPPKEKKSVGKPREKEAGQDSAGQHIVKDVSFVKSVKLGLF